MNNTIITLRKFLEITSGDLIEAYSTRVWIEEINNLDNSLIKRQVTFGGDNNFEFFEDMEDLNPYLDYELVKYHQETCCGEIDGSYIVIKKID